LYLGRKWLAHSIAPVGVSAIGFKNSKAQGFTLRDIWLTGNGENYMRQLEEAPGIARKLTATAIVELWQMGKGAIVSTAGQLLAEFTKHYHR